MILSTSLTQAGVYLLTGILAGMVSGLIGLGGGIVIVPALLYIFSHKSGFPQPIIMHLAAGTSLAVMFLTAQSSIRTHARQEPILWELYRRLWPGLILGALSGSLFSQMLSPFWLRIIFGLFLLVLAFKMLADINKQIIKPYHFPPTWLNLLINFFIGGIAGLLGVGGGALIVPYLNYCHVPIKKIAPLAALSTLSVALVGALIFIIVGWGRTDLPAYSTGFVYWPAVAGIAITSSIFAPLGAKLTYIIPVKQLKIGFILLLIATAIDLLI